MTMIKACCREKIRTGSRKRCDPDFCELCWAEKCFVCGESAHAVWMGHEAAVGICLVCATGQPLAALLADAIVSAEWGCCGDFYAEVGRDLDQVIFQFWKAVVAAMSVRGGRQHVAYRAGIAAAAESDPPLQFRSWSDRGKNPIRDPVTDQKEHTR